MFHFLFVWIFFLKLYIYDMHYRFEVHCLIENIHSINLENRSLWRTIPSIIFVQKGSMRMLWLQLMLFVSCSNVKWFGRNSIFALYISLKMKAKLTHILGSKHCSPPSTLHVCKSYMYALIKACVFLKFKIKHLHSDCINQWKNVSFLLHLSVKEKKKICR